MVTSSTPLPPLSAVRVFEATARHLNFTRAAEELGVSQSAVSYQIKLLEDRLGAALFTRAPRHMTLTDSGARLAPVITESFEAMRLAFANLAEDGQRILSISAPHTLSANWLAQRIGGFQMEHPAVAVRLDSSDDLIDLSHSDIDVGIRSGLGQWAGLTADRLFSVEDTPVCSPALIERLGPIRTPADLLRFPLITPADPRWIQWFSAAGLTGVGLSAQSGVNFAVQHLEGKAAVAGDGVAMVNPTFFAAELASGRLVRPIDLTLRGDRSFWLVYPRDRRGSAKIRAFRGWILAQVEAMPAQPMRYGTVPM